MVSIISKYFFISLLLVGNYANGQGLTNHKDTHVRFEVVSVRLLTTEEKMSDNIGMDAKVRFRLTNTGRATVYLYTSWKDYISPDGYTITVKGDQIRWFTGINAVVEKSPGIDKLVKRGDGGSWLKLTSGTSIEFDLFDSTTRPSEHHAQTLFMKTSEKGPVTEVYSDFYLVPKIRLE